MMDLPRLGLGCAALGRATVPDAVAHATIIAALDAGVRHFDTAPLYGGGLSERRLGAVLRERPDAAVTVATKAGYVIDFPEGTAPPPADRRQDFSPDAIRRSLDASLARLGRDRVDLLHLHDPSGDPAAAEPAIRALRDDGRLGAIGIGSTDCAAACRLVAALDLDAVLIAGRFTLLDRSAADLLPLAAARGVTVIAGGVFSSGILAAERPAAARYDYAPPPEGIVCRVEAMAAVAHAHGTTLRAAALGFVLAEPRIHTVLLGAENPAELREMRAAPPVDAKTLAAIAAVPA